MILVDKDLKAKVEECQMLRNYYPDNFTCIGYDLTSEYFTNHQKETLKNYDLEPGESVFVGTKEMVNVPVDLAARIILKNSRIRQGLSLDAPLYQPGHETRVFFRVTNVSKSRISLESGDKLATIVFEELSNVPELPYTGTFQSEFDYNGMGKYGAEYAEQIQKVNKKITDLKDVEKSVYGNVITLMTIFIGIFSLVNINLTAAATGELNLLPMIGYNLAIIGGVSTLAGLIRVLVPSLSKNNLPKWYWILPVVSFAVSILLTLIP